MTRVIALFNQSGGVGKTTITINLGYRLADRGHRVLLIDMDPQASLTAFMGLELGEQDKTIYDALLSEDEEPTIPIYKMLDEAKGRVPHNVMGGSEVAAIQSIFDGIALMEWQSFVTNRLPLLKLPKDVLDLIRQGLIAYTKALAIARLKDEAQRRVLLKATVEEDLSLSQIRERIRAFQVQPDSTSPKSIVESISRRVIKAKLWEDSKKWKQVQALLEKLENLIAKE